MNKAPLRTASLHTRLSLLLTLVLVAMLIVASAQWLRETRNAIREELESAGQVAEQWLRVVIAESGNDGADRQLRLMSALRTLGRIRAHELQISADGGVLLYTSPGATYKAGRMAPEWFAAQLSPSLRTRHFDAGPIQISLIPDASRSVLDAWDDLAEMLGWAVAAVLLAGIICNYGLRRALVPLRRMEAAFIHDAARGNERRLPSVGAAELDRFAASYNRLAAELDDTLADNVLLAADQCLAQAVHDRLQAERELIARELHDELAQGITAVQSIAGAILQRSAEAPGIFANAQAIIAMTTQIQDGIRTILQRLRQPAAEQGGKITDVVSATCRQWAELYPQVSLQYELDPDIPLLASEQIHAVKRLLQEALTNVARHAGATAVTVDLACSAELLSLRICDNGCGFDQDSRSKSSRYGVLGMRERVHALGGKLSFSRAPGGGCCVDVQLPLRRPFDGARYANEFMLDASET